MHFHTPNMVNAYLTKFFEVVKKRKFYDTWSVKIKASAVDTFGNFNIMTIQIHPLSWLGSNFVNHILLFTVFAFYRTPYNQ